ncbi:MAG: CBS domain-containing protein [Candidatus Binatia bacterium]
MIVRNRMTSPVVTVAASAHPDEARRLLARHRIRQLPVVRGTRLAGIVTDRDLRAASAAGASSVATLMTPKPLVIAPDAAVDEAARLLRAHKIGALPVVERTALVGILTVSDVLDAFVDLSGVSETSYRLAIAGATPAALERALRQSVTRHRGELKWLHHVPRSRPPRLEARVRAPHVDEIVAAIEAQELDVLGVVATVAGSGRALRPAPRGRR